MSNFTSETEQVKGEKRERAFDLGGELPQPENQVAAPTHRLLPEAVWVSLAHSLLSVYTLLRLYFYCITKRH